MLQSETLLDGLDVANTFISGKPNRRITPSVVFSDIVNFALPPEELTKEISNKKKFSQQETSNLHSFLIKFRQMPSQVSPYTPNESFFSAEDLTIAKKSDITIAPSPEKVTTFMLQGLTKFCAEDQRLRIQQDLKGPRNTEEDFIRNAAYLHQLIGKVHPYADGNGQTARTASNSYLASKGIHPVIHMSEELYTQAVQGNFAAYLLEESRKMPERIKKGQI